METVFPFVQMTQTLDCVSKGGDFFRIWQIYVHVLGKGSALEEN